MQAPPFCSTKCTLRYANRRTADTGAAAAAKGAKVSVLVLSRALLIAAAGARAAVACIQLHTPGAAAD
jgi:hypothetical protein